MLKTKISLTKKQKDNLTELKRKHKSTLVRDRAQAVLARNNSLTISNIAKALSRSEYFVKQSIYRFKKGKLSNIALSGNNRKLTQQQRKKIIKMIKNNPPKI